jgi:polar amino acid transport system substrate-binding protein
LDLPDLPLDFHLACSLKTSPELVAKLRNALAQLKRDGRYQKIVGDWSEQFKASVAVP